MLGARHAGLQAELFTGLEAFATLLNRLGIPVTVPSLPPGPRRSRDLPQPHAARTGE
ncbi:hypothetical protein [Kitasatospora sp. HPMI-4]|uniref:hypothetical protein n=1 Tax=Kitasatospora sp. HPMI-4 TaxID=3448443 RepID=UPI003F1B862C